MNGEQCLLFSLENQSIILHKLNKCGSKGTLLLNLLEKYAKNEGVKTISLSDSSSLETECSGGSVHIDLAALKLLTTGKSWYNSLGYFPGDGESYNEAVEISQLSVSDALHLSESRRLKNVVEEYSD